MASANTGRSSTSLDHHSNDGDKLFAAAAERNKNPIFDALKSRELLPTQGILLEIASGTGQHAAFFAGQLEALSSSSSSLVIQPTEADESALPSIRAHTAGMSNVLPPVVLDVARDPPERWPQCGGGVEKGGKQISAVFCANLSHISPFEATLGLFRGCGFLLNEDGALFLYGPFAVDGRPATPSDTAFDASLRARNAEWGYRDIETEIKPAAEASGLVLEEKIDMPANNFLLVFRKK